MSFVFVAPTVLSCLRRQRLERVVRPIASLRYDEMETGREKHLPNVTIKHATARSPSEVDVDALMTQAGRGGGDGERGSVRARHFRQIQIAHYTVCVCVCWCVCVCVCVLRALTVIQVRVCNEKNDNAIVTKTTYIASRGSSVTANGTRLRRDTRIERLIYGGAQFYPGRVVRTTRDRAGR